MTSSSIPQHDDSKLQDILGIIGIQPVVSMSSCRAPRHSSGGRFTRDIIKDRASSVRLRHGGDSSLCASRGVCLLLLVLLLSPGVPGKAWGQPPERISPPVSPTRSSPVSVETIQPWLAEIPLKTRRGGILPEEAELYYQVLGYVRDVDSAALKQAARNFLQERWRQSKYRSKPFEKFPVYVDLYQHPEEYQGRPVTMTGHLQRSVASPAGENLFAIDQICEAWLFTEDSQANPTVVVTTHFPENFPIGEQTVDRVTVTGYIYRMYTYEARDTGRFAPLLLAQKIEWIPPEELGANDRSWIWMMLGLLVMLLVALLLGAAWTRRTRQQPSFVSRELPGEIISSPEARSEVKRPGGPPGS